MNLSKGNTLTREQELFICFDLKGFREAVYNYKTKHRLGYRNITACTGLQIQTVINFFKGRRTPSIATLFKLATWADVSIDKYIRVNLD